MYCRNCGEQILPGHAFCDACGASLYENGRVSESKVSETPVENPPGVKGEVMKSASYIATVLVLLISVFLIGSHFASSRPHRSTSSKAGYGSTQMASNDNNSGSGGSSDGGSSYGPEEEESQSEAGEMENGTAAGEETSGFVETADESGSEVSSDKHGPSADARVKGEWVSSPKGWKFYDENGRMLANEWLEDGPDHWFYFGEDGFMLQNTVTPDGYYVGEDGEMISDPAGQAGSSESYPYTFGTGTALPAAATGQIAGEFVFPNSSNLPLSASDMNGKTEWECRVARNEIYARHGRKFKDASLQAHFDSCSWYKGTISPDAFRDDTVLSRLEKDNIKVIEAYEKQHHYNNH